MSTDTTAKQGQAPRRGGPKPVQTQLDAEGRLILPSEEERKAQADEVRKMLARWEEEGSDGDPAEDLEILRGIDANRGPGQRKLFEEYR